MTAKKDDARRQGEGGPTDAAAHERPDGEAVLGALRRAERFEVLGRMTGGLAHDFNNVVAVVLGNLRFLENELKDNPQALQRLSWIRLGAERGADIIARLLRLSAAKEPSPEPLDISDVVDALASAIRSAAGPDIEVSLQPARGLCAVMADWSEVGLCVLNLVIAARDAMGFRGTMKLETTTVPSQSPEQPTGYCALTLIAEGPQSASPALDPVEHFARRQGGVVTVAADKQIVVTLQLPTAKSKVVTK